jgi:hypothetical protein
LPEFAIAIDLYERAVDLFDKVLQSCKYFAQSTQKMVR